MNMLKESMHLPKIMKILKDQLCITIKAVLVILITINITKHQKRIVTIVENLHGQT